MAVKSKKISPLMTIGMVVALAILLKFLSDGFLESQSLWLVWVTIVLVTALGIYLIKLTADIIEDSTAVLKDRTGLAGGMLQAFGTALPDMIIGMAAALLSLGVVKSNPQLAFSYALIATSATFGSNIYNIGFAAWCLHRQNVSCKKDEEIPMFPLFGGGIVKPMSRHINKPFVFEFNTSIRVLSALTFLTTFIVMGMVFFGRVSTPYASGDVYQLNGYLGLLVLIFAIGTLIYFRKDHSRSKAEPENPFINYHQLLLWATLLVSGVSIFIGAEAMVEALNRFSELTSIPVIFTGVAAGIIGCLGEMMVIYNFTTHPKGRIGDAVVGIAMDNILTIIGASIVAILGGIYLGSNALIVIFVLILMLNTVLMWQVSELKDEYIREDYLTAHLIGQEVEK